MAMVPKFTEANFIEPHPLKPLLLMHFIKYPETDRLSFDSLLKLSFFGSLPLLYLGPFPISPGSDSRYNAV